MIGGFLRSEPETNFCFPAKLLSALGIPAVLGLGREGRGLRAAGSEADVAARAWFGQA